MAATADARAAVEAVWRIESARLVAGLARLVRDVGLAEDLAQDALLAALERWPRDGVPDNPGAWLMATAKNRAIDLARRASTYQRKREEVAHELGVMMAMDGADFAAQADDEVGDDLLALMFTCCHPALSTEARVALTLRLLGGLTTPEIARAFLVGEPTVAQRLTRAKRTLREVRADFEVPIGSALRARLPDVLEVVYLIFNEGYAASSGDRWVRTELCEEALRLGRILAALAPEEPEAHGLIALLEIQASRLGARLGPDGEPILLLDQDRSRWDPLLIVRGVAALKRAEELPAPLGPYGLQATIAACHGRALEADDTDWVRIAALYEALGAIAPSPIVELNRAVAVGMAFGPEFGLALLERVAADPTLRNYHLLPSVRGDLLARLGRDDEAAAEFRRAAELTDNAPERALLLRRAERIR
ncbi:MAG TPA: sigma-70 family RNA polymerase sigma factor [Solirubrobacterales bacterium]|jgi:RNA polymerase sigma factor (sigma-70 family)|nr:sigma-70 family RNA polymerase sigma factor [Solirubrobacterales bacterium]